MKTLLEQAYEIKEAAQIDRIRAIHAKVRKTCPRKSYSSLMHQVSEKDKQMVYLDQSTNLIDFTPEESLDDSYSAAFG